MPGGTLTGATSTASHSSTRTPSTTVSRVTTSGPLERTASVRSTDTVYRYGGEEIAVVMRETDLESAKQLGERLREAVEHHFAAPAQPRPVTISVGVASMPIHATSLPELVGAADQALYEAKRSGRNRTVIAGPEVVGAS